MKKEIVLLGLFAVLASFQGYTQDCAPDGDIQFVCGPVSPEDLVHVPNTDWIVAAGMEDDGYLYFVNTQSLNSESVYPVSNPNHQWDRQRYNTCPGPETSGFRPHGLHLIPGDGNTHELLVVRHGARESIEVFSVDASQPTPSIAWLGCVVAPDGVVFNSVAATPEGGMVATHFQLPSGVVYEWELGGEWEMVPGSETSGPNGIEISPDGDWLYIGGWGTRSLIKLSRGQAEVAVETVEVAHHIDNVRWTEDGSLLAAGHIGPEFSSIGSCLAQLQCEGVRSRVTRIDIDDMSAQQIVDYPSNDDFILGTVAIEVNDEIWVGGIAGADRIARFANP